MPSHITMDICFLFYGQCTNLFPFYCLRGHHFKASFRFLERITPPFQYRGFVVSSRHTCRVQEAVRWLVRCDKGHICYHDTDVSSSQLATRAEACTLSYHRDRGDLEHLPPCALETSETGISIMFLELTCAISCTR